MASPTGLHTASTHCRHALRSHSCWPRPGGGMPARRGAPVGSTTHYSSPGPHSCVRKAAHCHEVCLVMHTERVMHTVVLPGWCGEPATRAPAKRGNRARVMQQAAGEPGSPSWGAGAQPVCSLLHVADRRRAADPACAVHVAPVEKEYCRYWRLPSWRAPGRGRGTLRPVEKELVEWLEWLECGVLACVV
jgi:hypothetical protein